MMKTLLIGVGAAGNKAALDVLNDGTSGVEKEDVILVNSTEADIPDGFDGRKIIISPNGAGCGKERNRAKTFITSAISSGVFNLVKDVDGYDLIVVITSLEGGTGCGSAPIIARYCDQVLGKNTHLIGFTGFEEDARGLQNTVEFFQEITDGITVHVIQNKLFSKLASSKYKAEKLANKELITRIKLVNGSMIKASSQNIDSTDIYKVANTRGYTTAEYCEVDESLADVEDFDKICKKMIYESKSLKTVKGVTRLAVIMNLAPESEDAIDSSFRVLKDTYGVPFESFTHMQYDPEQPEFIAFIASGMKLPLDEVKAIFERYKAESEKVNKNQDSFFDEVRSLKGDEKDSEFNSDFPDEKQKMDISSFLSTLETKPKASQKGTVKK